MALRGSLHLLSWGVLLTSVTSTPSPLEGSSASPEFHQSSSPATETGMNKTEATTKNYTGLTCDPLLPPRRGSFYVERGTGMSVATELEFWCLEGYQLVGTPKITCIVLSGKAQWSTIPRPEDRGLRVAVLASVVSGIIILAMSVSFIICCLQERMNKNQTHTRSRKRGKRKSSWRSECWLERDEGDWEAFPPPKIYNLSLDPHLSPESPVYMGGLTGYDNRGYQRSQENLLKAPLPGLYRSETQMYPHVVLQRVPTPTVPSAPSVPVFLRLSPPPTSENPNNQTALPSYPNGAPQHLWQ
ncbi:hypothetical protein DNTS_003102 [Danionella cerebrum]|uniref:Sushi domain-containing protein n=1 Tax=Danionella cerebrum TaxID=2873325 RepID=A0A553N0F1_9TELE|nr:hypothetical protein DNTS_003102 [Danionella translucida]